MSFQTNNLSGRERLPGRIRSCTNNYVDGNDKGDESDILWHYRLLINK